MKSLGICVGASTLSAVELDHDGSGTRIVRNLSVPHQGNPRKSFSQFISAFKIREFRRIAVTGRKFRDFIDLTTITESEAIECALELPRFKNRAISAVVSAGGETFIAYILGKNKKIKSIQTGNKCASGTGEFYLQQLRRMELSLEESLLLGRSQEPFPLSGRCSVFCKSDCTHAMNKGIAKGRVAAGLCRMMAGKVLELLTQIPKRNIMIIGGTARNEVMLDYLGRVIENLIVPEEAVHFEALGAALWALKNETMTASGGELFKTGASSFSFLPPLGNYSSQVDFKQLPGSKDLAGKCIVGLDVGSTTTKAVVMRTADDSVIASTYRRTKGNPVQASRECYRDLFEQLGDRSESIEVAGLGVTGSGRQIAGLHALTEGIINEIIAHATGALYYDGQVDTIFEIGGQDAKYIFITNGIPSDYAMNDACSAGTGSFLEEAAKESLGIMMEEIGGLALAGENPPNFNDQCAAFIGSDIKNASHEGLNKEDIVAGLVYSVCMNYNNRVKGNRQVGNRIFMQGGVCYNRAVPIAMAALTGKKVIVPPDPGLIGAFGVALEIKKRINSGILPERRFSLRELYERKLEFETPFRCDGKKENCDRKCEIARIRIDGRLYPFGGACNRWYNLRNRKNIGSRAFNQVSTFEKMIFDLEYDLSDSPGASGKQSIGINKSFQVNTYLPLFRTFFESLGFRVILPDTPEQDGIDKRGAPFCYPAELAHGFFSNLLEKAPDYLFLPHIKGTFLKDDREKGLVCPISQSEPYYLGTAFKENRKYKELKKSGRILIPIMDLSRGLEEFSRAAFDLGKKLKCQSTAVEKAITKSFSAQQKTFERIEELGKGFLERLESDPEQIAIVILGRNYNSSVSEAHMGIPGKFASRGLPVIPNEFLPYSRFETHNMFWSAGRRILSGAEFVARHPQLYACYISNFSCGPDSFIIGYAREMMNGKPFLNLELDSHVADAGLETRIEAFIDIIRNYRQITLPELPARSPSAFRRARFDHGTSKFVDSRGASYPLHHPRVHVIIPSMGNFLNQTAAAIFRGSGINATALPPADPEVLKLGRGHTTCKECLPLQLTVGSFLKYLEERKSDRELALYFITTAGGPCRFGQYSVFLERLIENRRIPDTALFSLTAEDSYYTGLEDKTLVNKLWAALVICDIMQDIYSMLLANAVNSGSALSLFEEVWEELLVTLEFRYGELCPIMEKLARRMSVIELRKPVSRVPVVLLTGEIYVRHDGISRQALVEKLGEKGFATKVAGMIEWLYYTDWCYRAELKNGQNTWRKRLALYLRSKFMRNYEKKFKSIWSKSGLIEYRLDEVDHAIRNVMHLIHPDLRGEAVLTTATAMSEVPDPYCGVIAIGPFGCMPNRVAEAILSREMNREGKIASRTYKGFERVLDEIEDLPFLAIESDGNPFPQLITAKLETFLLQCDRTHEQVLKTRSAGH